MDLSGRRCGCWEMKEEIRHTAGISPTLNALNLQICEAIEARATGEAGWRMEERAKLTNERSNDFSAAEDAQYVIA